MGSNNDNSSTYSTEVVRLQTEVVEQLTGDIQRHRDYIHRLYRSAFIAGGTLIVIFTGLVTWFLKYQFDAKVVNYFISEKFEERITPIVEHATERANKQSKSLVEEHFLRAKSLIEEDFSKQVKSSIDNKVETLNTSDILDSYQKAIIPVGAVIPFNRETGCPENWTEYKPAYGRFIRGIDKSNESIDPKGERQLGDLQEDEFKLHSHGVRVAYHSGNKAGGGWSMTHNIPTTDLETGHLGQEGGLETRPKNVALLFCERK